MNQKICEKPPCFVTSCRQVNKGAVKGHPRSGSHRVSSVFKLHGIDDENYNLEKCEKSFGDNAGG